MNYSKITSLKLICSDGNEYFFPNTSVAQSILRYLSETPGPIIDKFLKNHLQENCLVLYGGEHSDREDAFVFICMVSYGNGFVTIPLTVLLEGGRQAVSCGCLPDLHRLLNLIQMAERAGANS